MTKLGLLSDSHGRSETTAIAVQHLLERGVDVLIHLGDIETVQVLDALAVVSPTNGEPVASHLVFGNCDWDQQALATYASDLGLHAHHPAGRLVVDGKQVGFTHGHLSAVMNELMTSGVDYLLHGHTHLLADTTLGGTRVINPGALHRARRFTVATLTPSTGEFEVIEVPSVTLSA